MEESLKKRLIGAVVLVSLAVIFVPMLVEDEPVVSSHITDTNIPPRPELQSVDVQGGAPQGAETTAAPQGQQSFALPLPESVQNAAPPPPPPPGVETPVAVEPPPPPPPPPVAASKPEPAAKPAPPPAPKPVPAPAPKTPSKPAAPGGWVVQLGSFSDKANADSLTAQLRKAGFEAFQDEVRVGDKVLYRVRVGPEADRQRAEKLQADIQSSLKLSGQVRNHP